MRACVPSSRSAWCTRVQDGLYEAGCGPSQGVQLAREMGMLLYRSRQEFDQRFDWSVRGPVGVFDVTHDVESYLEYQGEKFSGGYDAK